MQNIDPCGQSDGGQQCCEHNDAGGKNMIVSRIFCHNVARDSGGRAEHDENRHELLIAIPQVNGKR